MTGNKCALLIFKSINTRSKHNGSFQKIKRKLLKSDFCVFFESIRFDNDIDPARNFLNCALPAPRTIELVKLRKPNSNSWVTIFYKVNSNLIFPSWLLIYIDQSTLNTVISGIEASLLFNFGLLEQSCIRVLTSFHDFFSLIFETVFYLRLSFIRNSLLFQSLRYSLSGNILETILLEAGTISQKRVPQIY